MAKEIVCTNCGYVGKAKTLVKGSVLVELALWVAFLLPGIIYSIWRSNSRQQVCPTCGAQTLVPTNSPNGIKILQSQGKN